jgi:hypothetical protein
MVDKIKTPSKHIVSPRGVAGYSYLNKPDTKYDADGVYRVTMNLDTGDAEVLKFIAATDAALEEAEVYARAELTAQLESAEGQKKGQIKQKLANLKVADSPIKQVYDEDGNETTTVKVEFKSKAKFKDRKTETVRDMKPKILDGKKNEIPFGSLQIGGGTEMKVGAQRRAYYIPGTNTCGVSFKMNVVQILKLVEFGGSSDAAYDFGDDDEDGEDLTSRIKQPAAAPAVTQGARDEDAEDEDF